MIRDVLVACGTLCSSELSPAATEVQWIQREEH